MENDELQRPYSVCTRDDLKEKMNKQINDISEIFCVSNSEATVLLMKHRWNSHLLSELLCQETESGSITDSNQDLSDSDSSSDDVDGKVSTPFCSHKFSITYWSNYLEANMKDTISCPSQNCGATVGRDAIQNLTVNKRNRRDEYVLRSYLEKRKRKKQIKQCPARGGCSYFIEFPRRVDAEEYGLNVVCLCGHTFCWRCSLESHNPVTCNNASDWLSRDLKKFNVSWNETNTKPCPHCQSPLEIFLGSRSVRFVPCVNCSGFYCWECMQSEESHETGSGSNGDCVELEPVTEQEEVDASCLDRWEASEVSMEEARSELRAFEESNNMVLREGLMLIVQCRQFLKWSCVYEHLHLKYEDSKKEFLRFLQDYAKTLVQSYSETLKDEAGKALSEPTLDDVTCSRGNLSAVTISIGNYFYNFAKALQDGLDVVEVRHYDDSSPCWLCDRCTYANTWLHKVCQMCYDDESHVAVEKPSD